MKKTITLFFIAFIFNTLSAYTDTSVCNWKSRINSFQVNNNCDSNGHSIHIIGKIGLNQIYNCKKPVRRVWRLNNTVIGNGENLYYMVSQNGTYNICLSLYDSCNNCDTVICQSVKVACVGCNWKSKIGGFDAWNNCDSNKNTKNIIAKFYLNQNYNCNKKYTRQWSVNKAVVGYGEKIYYQVSTNGTYTVCMTVYDSCNKCDTMICKTVTINCFPACEWKSKLGGFDAWNNCDSNKSTKNIIAKFYLNQNYKCNKKYSRKWTVNNQVVGYDEKIYYRVFNNGTYNVCMTVYDSCNHCDTTICKTVVINCFSGCNWKSKINDFSMWNNCDSNKTPVYVNGRFIFNKNYTCSKRKVWKWTVNNAVVSYSENLHYQLSKNGTYNVCLYLYDSCNNCDTSYCKSVTVSCIKDCNWKSKINDFSVWNSCDSNKTPVYVNGRFIFNKNYTCSKRKVWKWTVNNAVVSYSENLHYQVLKNGTYNVCLYLYDSCNNCDTSYCKSVTVSCIKDCNWKSKINDFSVWNSCDSNKTPVYVNGRFIFNKNYTCSKRKVWKWMVNNAVVSHSENLHYQVLKNGTYNVCLYFYDSCNNCDTSYCKSITVSCIKGCNWNNKIGGFDVRTNCDSNTNSVNIIGKFYLNQNYQCNKKVYRKWVVNNAVAGYGENLYYQVSKNGAYKVCMVVLDSCNQCDTSVCKTIEVKCHKLSLDEMGEVSGIQLYPNPASDWVYVECDPVFTNCKINLLDISGRLVQNVDQTLAENGAVILNIKNLPAGIYVVRAVVNGQFVHLRLVKN